jgi:hypothetical protein
MRRTAHLALTYPILRDTALPAVVSELNVDMNVLSGTTQVAAAP